MPLRELIPEQVYHRVGVVLLERHPVLLHDSPPLLLLRLLRVALRGNLERVRQLVDPVLLGPRDLRVVGRRLAEHLRDRLLVVLHGVTRPAPAQGVVFLHLLVQPVVPDERPDGVFFHAKVLGERLREIRHRRVRPRAHQDVRPPDDLLGELGAPSRDAAASDEEVLAAVAVVDAVVAVDALLDHVDGQKMLIRLAGLGADGVELVGVEHQSLVPSLDVP